MPVASYIFSTISRFGLTLYHFTFWLRLINSPIVLAEVGTEITFLALNLQRTVLHEVSKWETYANYCIKGSAWSIMGSSCIWFFIFSFFVVIGHFHSIWAHFLEVNICAGFEKSISILYPDAFFFCQWYPFILKGLFASEFLSVSRIFYTGSQVMTGLSKSFPIPVEI